MHQEVDAIGRKQLFQFKSVNPGCIASLDVEKEVVVVDDVADLDAEGFGVPKRAIRNAVYRQKGKDGVAAVGVENRVQALQVGHQFIPFPLSVEAIHPKGVAVVLVQNGHAALEPKQVLVRDWDGHCTAMLVEVILQVAPHWKRDFLFGNEFVRQGKSV